MSDNIKIAYPKATAEELSNALSSVREPNSPIDQRIQNFIAKEFGEDIKLPNYIELTKGGFARDLALPKDGNKYENELVKSYRTRQGVLHNNFNDRRTTKGSFHVCDSGLPIAADKIQVPCETFKRMLKAAMTPLASMAAVPYNGQDAMLGLHLNPVVRPEIIGVQSAKYMEVRFFVPGGLVSNLDFVENIFLNAGDPALPENDLALNPESYAGVTGCVILAPQLIKMTKKELGLPHVSEATPLQKKQGTCWEDESELYNNGGACKITHRTMDGVVITLIADNYFGYCKKEVKTQLSFAANLIGNAEEEHAGGALVFPSYSLGEYFKEDSRICKPGEYLFSEFAEAHKEHIIVKPEGYAIDKEYKDIYYVPENAYFDVHSLRISWKNGEEKVSIPLSSKITYLHPSGYRIELAKHLHTKTWHLVGTLAEGSLLHKPSTVSGGGKSEISKSIDDVIISHNFYINNLEEDLDRAEAIINHDFGSRFKDPEKNNGSDTRELLSTKRSLGSVIKLLTPSSQYNDEYNRWLKRIPTEIKQLVFVIKRYHEPVWGKDWRKHFSVDILDGQPGHELMYKHEKLTARYLRMGVNQDGTWRTFRLRQDYMPAKKIQVEDDITASTVIRADRVEGLRAFEAQGSKKFVKNCEYKLFQRPDEAIHKGVDKQTENDFAGYNVFVSNFEPLQAADAVEIMEDVVEFDKFSQPMKEVIEEAAKLGDDQYFVCSAKPRIVNGAPTKNVRYLQVRPDLVKPKDSYLADLTTRMKRKVGTKAPVLRPVNAILIGRRNNPPSPGIKMLSVYNPIHYQELPELTMDFIATLSGKSPSTTGFGTEGALTKGPFNMLRPSADINNVIVSYILTQDAGFSTACGYVGVSSQFDHDISYFAPELWSRMSPEERDPAYLIENGYLDKLEDYYYKDEKVLASRLGYRINRKFTNHFGGRVFSNPEAVFPDDVLMPELQSPEDYAEGIAYIVDSQKTVAQNWFEDGSIDEACPPLKALLHIMVDGTYAGKTIKDPEIRQLFNRENMLKSDWYKKRLLTQKEREIALWNANIEYLEAKKGSLGEKWDAELDSRIALAKETLKGVESDEYVDKLVGSIGADPFGK